MDAGDPKSKPALGFLTVLEHPQHGLFGGYLVLNLAGRPLEFHCTAPIKPNRAQQILYGPTLEPFLYGEQIGQTLLRQAKTEPLVVCTDCPPALALRELVSTPVVLVLKDEPEAAAEPATSPAQGVVYEPTARRLRVDPAHGGGPRLVIFALGRSRLALPERSQDDRQLITERLAGLDAAFDLAEPFARIREAIEEAQRAVR
jgi:hypothetical protein